MKTIRSPFKFLDPFTLADRDKFFGRDEATRQLFDLVFKTPLALIYGLSGAGKTSLIQCGLASRFDGTDWLPLWIRRQSDVNDALKAAIDKAMPQKAPETERSVSDSITALYQYYLRPVFLIFDQFEEIFILGNPGERDQFIQQLQTLLEEELPCTILIVIREEYLGQLYPFEKKIPSLFDFRMRVEPMDAAHVKTVLAQSFQKFHISVEPPAEKRFDEIIENVSQGKSGIELPYLQVYLDMLYRKEVESAPDQGNTTGELMPLTLTAKAVRDFGSIDNVLNRFLSEQQERIQEEAKLQDSALPDEAVRQILDGFVSEEGTKRPVHYARADGLFYLNSVDQDYFPAVSPGSLSFCFRALEQARLIRITEDTIELAHDSLANLIDQRRSAAQRRNNELRRRLHYAFDEHLQTGQWLNMQQISSFEETLPELKATAEQKKFVADSRQFQENEKNRELAEAKAQADMERKRAEEAERQRKIAWFLTATAVLGLMVAGWFYRQSDKSTQQAQRATKQANIDKNNALLSKKEADVAKDTAIMERVKADSLGKVAVNKANEAELNFQLAQKSAIEATAATKKAEQNLALANEQKGIAAGALLQAELNLQKAVAAETAAKAEQAKTKKALDDVLAANISIVVSYLKDIDEHILKLEYETALEKCQTALELKVEPQKREIQKRLVEIAYVFTETDTLAAAIQALNLIKPTNLSVNAPNIRQNLMAEINRLRFPGDSAFLEKRYYPEMIDVEGGVFLMGDKSSLVHKVRLSSFSIAKTETTVWQYFLYLRANHKRQEEPLGWGYEGNNPMVNVSWYDAVEYCNWVSRQKRKLEVYYKEKTESNNKTTEWGANWHAPGYRLPTEAEWEFAARGGAQSIGYEYSGSNTINDVAWFSVNSNNRTHLVAQKRPNELGLFDMSGNAWEWCFDSYGAYSSAVSAADSATVGKPASGDKEAVYNPTGADKGADRVFRGGSWDGRAGGCRVSDRGYDAPTYRNDNIGFRVASSL